MHPLAIVLQHPEQFTMKFVRFLPDNLHVWAAFEREASVVVQRGFQHYSARTIVHFLRHHTNVREAGGGAWKINNDHSPYLARLWALAHPEHADLFEFRLAHRRAHKAP